MSAGKRMGRAQTELLANFVLSLGGSPVSKRRGPRVLDKDVIKMKVIVRT